MVGWAPPIRARIKGPTRPLGPVRIRDQSNNLPLLVIDDNSTKIWKLSSFGFMLLAQAILPFENNFGQIPQTRNGSISSPYICARVFHLKLAHMHRLENVGE